jgi:hypothetical protein
MDYPRQAYGGNKLYVHPCCFVGFFLLFEFGLALSFFNLVTFTIGESALSIFFFSVLCGVRVLF